MTFRIKIKNIEKKLECSWSQSQILMVNCMRLSCYVRPNQSLLEHTYVKCKEKDKDAIFLLTPPLMDTIKSQLLKTGSRLTNVTKRFFILLLYWTKKSDLKQTCCAHSFEWMLLHLQYYPIAKFYQETAST